MNKEVSNLNPSKLGAESGKRAVGGETFIQLSVDSASIIHEISKGLGFVGSSRGEKFAFFSNITD
jgi:hypothetical protein